MPLRVANSRNGRRARSESEGPASLSLLAPLAVVAPGEGSEQEVAPRNELPVCLLAQPSFEDVARIAFPLSLPFAVSQPSVVMRTLYVGAGLGFVHVVVMVEHS